jgi:hypothetical protein
VVQLTGKRRSCSLVCSLDLSPTCALGKVCRSEISAGGIGIIFFYIWKACGCTSQKLQFIFWLFRKRLLKYLWTKNKQCLPAQDKEAASHSGARKQAPLTYLPCLFSLVIIFFRSGSRHRKCPQGFRCGQWNTHQPSSS